MRLSFDGVIATVVILCFLAFPAWIVYDCWFDRVEVYHSVKAQVQYVDYDAAHTEMIWNGKFYTYIPHSEEWTYRLKSDTVDGHIYTFRLTSDSDLGKIDTVTVHYGYRRISKEIKFSW